MSNSKNEFKGKALIKLAVALVQSVQHSLALCVAGVLHISAVPQTVHVVYNFKVGNFCATQTIG